MSATLGHLLAGLGGGAVVAALAVGLVLIHRATGVVDLAHAAVGLYVASCFFELRASGDLVLPVLGLPDRVHLVDRPTVATAAALTVLLAVVVAAAVHLLVVRPLRHASALSRLAATLGAFLYVQELVRLRFPPSSAGSGLRRSVLPEGSVLVLGQRVGTARLLVAVFVVLAAAGLWATYRWTRVGLASRAAADDERGARLLGLSPDGLAVAARAVATVLAGTALVFAEPFAGLGPATSLLVVPALAAALVGRLRSVPAAVAGGLGIGVLQSLVLGLSVAPGGSRVPSWLPVTGLQELLPTVLLLALLAWRGGLPSRGGPRRTVVPRAPRPTGAHLLAGLLPAAAVVVALFAGDADLRRALVVSMTFAILCLSVVVVAGYSGQLSLAQLAFAGVGAAAAVRLATRGVPFPAVLLLASLAGALVAALVGAATTRLRGASFAVATLAVAVVVERLVLQSSVMLGDRSRTMPSPGLFGIDLGASAPGAANYRVAFGLTVLVVLVVAASLVALLRRSGTGLSWTALRSDERAAAALGISVARQRVAAMAAGGAIAGAAGALMAYSVPSLSSQSFMAIGSVVALALTTLAGVSRIAGALIAGVLAQAGLLTTALGRWPGGAAEDAMLALSGVALVVTVAVAPEGLAGRWGPRLSARFRGPRPGGAAHGGPVRPAVTLRAHRSEEATA